MEPDGVDPAEKPEILVVCAEPPQILPALEEHFAVHVHLHANESDAVFATAAKRVRALVTGTMVGADERLIDSLAKIEIIACTGGHVDRIDVAAARARGIPVTNAPGISAPDVADLALAFILGVSRRLLEGHRIVRDGRWPGAPMGFGRRVGGKKVGILGLGGIGRLVMTSCPKGTPRIWPISAVTLAAGRMPPCPGFAPCDSLISIILTESSLALWANSSGSKFPSAVRQPK